MDSENAAPEVFLKPYDFKNSEAKINELWEKSGYSNPDVCVEKGITSPDAPAYSIVLPPPNVTGTLHMGHAAMLAIQDILIRYHRMRGERTLWLPGTDHAAIATQSVVEKDLLKTEKKSRHDLGREEFLKRVRKFAKESHDRIVAQIKAMGASVDWSREAYTLDEARNLAVRTAFKRMYEAGLIYRGARIVNWDPKMQTTVSDDEIEYIPRKDPFYYLQYGPFVIGTVRPETKFGDKYVVMHPDDSRYSQYKNGQKIELEWINGPITATVVKDTAIDMSFGSGVMTITPAHSGPDFEIATRHGLDIERIIDERGILLPVAGKFAGGHIKKARPLIVEHLKQKGLLVKTEENYEHNVALSSRGGGIIEPQIKEQWFVAVNKEFTIPYSEIPGIGSGTETTLKRIMRAAVESLPASQTKTRQAGGAVKIVPERFERVYYNWIDNLRDWCISRQIWYGHRIPVWYCLSCRNIAVDAEVKSKWFIVRHGQSTANIEKRYYKEDDEQLTDDGKKQIEQAAEQLRNQNIGLIISSPLTRCAESAKIISKIIGAEIEFDPELREREWGDAAGLSYQERQEKFGSYYEHYDRTKGNIETSQSVEERVARAFQKHKSIHGHKNVVIISHGSAIRMLIKKIHNLTFQETRERTEISNAEIISLDVIDSPCSNCGSDLFEQDPDTLDTWFSSGLWTFSTLGWPYFAESATKGKPEHENDFANYHPTSVLETGYDILFFWVARMILMSGFLLGQVPFRNVFLHGLVRDAKGRKMSKSLGNVLDPLVMTEKYGADAARLSLIIGAAPGNDVKLSEDRVRGYKHFANKIWNISRFVLESTAETRRINADNTELNPKVRHPMSNLKEVDKKLIEEVQGVARKVSEYIDIFRLDLAADALYHYVWHRFADEIIEDSKPILSSRGGSASGGKDSPVAASRRDTLYSIFNITLKLLHPFMPFVTEAIWQQLPEKDSELLMVARWPSLGGLRKSTGFTKS